MDCGASSLVADRAGNAWRAFGLSGRGSFGGVSTNLRDCRPRGRVSLGVTGSPIAFFNRTTFGTQTVTSLLNPGDYTVTAEVGRAPGGGTCTGSFDFDLDVGDFVQP